MNLRRTLVGTLLLSLSICGIASAAERAIVPVAGSIAGALGSNFRTEMQMHNPGTGVMRGTMSFLPGSGEPQSQSQTLSTLEYEIGPRKTVRFADVIESLGATGLGSLDILPTEGALPRVVVRAFDDQGNFGTRGLVVPVLKESEAPVLGYRFVLVAPSDFDAYRFNIGVRTLGAEPSVLRVTERDAAGATVGDPITLTYEGETFRHKRAADLLGREVAAGHALSFETISGSAFVYATTVDNHSNDGSLQLDRPVNRPPVIDGQTITTDKNESVTVELSATDPDGDPIAWSVLTAPSHGTLSELAVTESLLSTSDASVVYTPASDYVGSDSFTIGVEDDVNGRAKATIAVMVGNAAGEAPTGVDDLYKVVEGDTLTIAAPGVLSNDSDPDGDPLTAQLDQGPLSAASFSFNPDGSFTYVPMGGFTGHDYFAYRASDGTNLSNLTNVQIETLTLNSPPNAVSDVAATDEDTSIGINVIANDTDPEGDPLSVISVNTTGTLGTVTIGLGGVVNYDPTTSAVLQALAAAATQIDTFSYTIQDAGGDTDSATVTVTVTGIDDVATATNDAATLLEDAGATAILVLANDVDVDGGLAILIIGVTQGTNGAVVITGGGTGLTYTPAADFCGSDSFTYSITGGATATVNVTVTCVNDAPTANADAQSTAEDTQLVFAASTLTTNDVRGPANEAGQTLTVTSVTSPTGNGGTVSLAAGNITYTPPLNFIGADTFTYTVTDNGTTNGSPDPLSANGTVTVNVVCPTITVTNPATSTGTANTPFSQTFTQTGDVGGGLIFSTASTLPTGLTLSAAGVLSGTPTQTGSFPIVVTATNGNACSGTGATYTLVIACQTITVTNPANASGIGGSPFSETFTQTGAIGTATFTTASTLPTGLTLSTAGVLSGTPTQTGSFPIVVTVTDSNGCTGSGATYTLVLACPTITVTNPVNANGTAGTAFSETFTQSGAIGTTTFTTASTLPTGLTLSAAGVLSGTPTVTGSFPIVVLVTDSNGCTGTSATYNLTLACPTITVTNPANTSGTAGTAFSETFTQTGAVGTATFTTASTLPTGLTLSSAGVLSGTPTETGSFPIVVTVTDDNSCTGTSATYTLGIACQTITVTNPATTTGTVNSPFSQTFTESSSIGGATFTTASTLPTGLTLSAAGVLSGTPTQTGSFPIVVTVTDGNSCTGTSATYTLVIGCQTITVTNPATTSGTAGTPFSQTFTQTGAVGSATFTTASTLPTGLTLSAAGVLSGTPTQTGSFPIVVTVTDANGCTGTSATYTLVIGCQVITVTNPANATGPAGSPFSESFTQIGAIGSATFTTASTLPTGLTLSTAGVLSGTPTQGGAFPIVVTVTDSNGCTGTGATYTLVITCPTITVNNPANANGTAGVAFSEIFTQTGGVGAGTFTLASGTLPTALTLAANGTLSGTPTQTGSFPITVTATDSNGCTGTGTTYTIVIACPIITVNNPANANGTANAPFSETFTQTGGIGTNTFALASGVLPTGLTLAANGVLSGTPTVTGSFPITVTATDANGCTGTSATYTIVIACQTINVTNPATTTGTINAAFSQTFTQSSAVGTATFTTASTLPAGLTLSTGGVLSGTPTQSGSFPIVVTVTDSNGCTGTGATYTLVIGCQTITVTNPANTNGTVAAPFSETFTQTGAVGTATFTTASTLPTGITLSTAGVLSGTTTQAGSFPIVVTVTDSNGCTGTGATYNLVIACNVITVTNPGVTTGTAGTPFSQTFTQSGANGTATFTTSSTLPAGLTLATNGVLSGTPTQPGTFPIVVTVTDSNGCTGTGATYNFVIACQVITVNSPGVTTGTVDAAFSQTFTQSGAIGTAIFTSSSTLPSGLTLSAAGVLSGTPGQPGSFPIVVTVTDSNGCTGTSATYTLVIGCQTITVTNPAVTTATFNTAFSQSFGQTGVGTHTPATFTLASGTLPSGLTLSTAGVLSGTPSVTGTYLITVTVTDANGCSGTGSTYTLSVIPAAVNDTYNNLVNNTEAVVTGGSTAPPGTPFVGFTGTIIANDLPSGGISLTVGTFATTQGGSVTTAADGTFKYTPPAAPGAAALASDTFTYTITSNTGATATPTQATGTVTFNLVNRVWYVKNNFGGGGNGQSQAPFNTLAAAQAASTANDYVFVYFGDGTTTGQNAGFVVKNGQKLYGEGFALVVNTNTLVAAGSPPLIDNVSATAGIDAGVVVDATAAALTGVEIRGLNIRGNENAVDVTSTGANAIGVTIANNTIRGTGAGFEGIDINQGSTAATSSVIVTNNTWDLTGSHPGNAIDVARTNGAVSLNISNNTNILSTGAGGINVVGGAAANTSITGFANNTVHQNTVGTGISISNASFDVTPLGAYQQVSGGTTVIGASGNGVGTSGVVLTNVSGDLAFTGLDIYADNGSGLIVSGTGIVNTGAGTGTRVTVGAGVGIIEATNGPAVSLTSMTTDLPLSSLRSTNSTTTGVGLNSIAGTFSAGGGSAISGVNSAAGTSFQVGSSNAAIIYNGTITSTTGKGVDLTNNTGSTISFTGTMTMSSGTNTTFNATGGGTVTATDTSNTLTSTTGTALNVANTTIGAAGLKFRSVSAGTAASGPTNGIVLNATGSSGSLIISGTGLAGTGGTIQRTTGVGILLTSTENPQFNYMNIQNAGDDGIRGSSVNNMTLSNCTLTTNGNAAAENGLQLGEASGSIVGITGTLTMTGTTITGSAGNNVHIRNTSGTLAGMNISNSSFNNLNDTTGANSFLFEMSGTATNSTATLTNVTFDNNSPQRALEVQAHDTATIGDFVVTGSTFNNNGIHSSFTQDTSASIKFSVLNSNFQIADPLHAINVFSSATSTGGTMRGTIDGNTIGSAATSSSGAKGNAIRVLIQGRTQSIFRINNNVIRQVWLAGNGARGLDLQFLGPTAGAQPITQSDITITNNDIDTMAPGSSFPLAPIYMAADNQGSPARVRAQITGNNARNSVSGSYDYPTFDGNGAFLIFQEAATGAEGQLVDTGAASGTALSELQTANPATTSTRIYESGIVLIAGPINLP